jgi:DNA-binding transcriptional ArsR family regulator
MNLTTDISTGIGASRFGRDPTFAGRSRSGNVSGVQEDTRVSQTTSRRVDYRERLGAGPATVGDATAGFGVSKPAITKHVNVLEETGVLTRSVEGRMHVVALERHGGGRVDGSPAGLRGLLHRRRRRVPEGGRSTT